MAKISLNSGNISRHNDFFTGTGISYGKRNEKHGKQKEKITGKIPLQVTKKIDKKTDKLEAKIIEPLSEKEKPITKRKGLLNIFNNHSYGVGISTKRVGVDVNLGELSSDFSDFEKNFILGKMDEGIPIGNNKHFLNADRIKIVNSMGSLVSINKKHEIIFKPKEVFEKLRFLNPDDIKRKLGADDYNGRLKSVALLQIFLKMEKINIGKHGVDGKIGADFFAAIKEYNLKKGVDIKINDVNNPELMNAKLDLVQEKSKRKEKKLTLDEADNFMYNKLETSGKKEIPEIVNMLFKEISGKIPRDILEEIVINHYKSKINGLHLALSVSNNITKAKLNKLIQIVFNEKIKIIIQQPTGTKIIHASLSNYSNKTQNLASIPDTKPSPEIEQLNSKINTVRGKIIELNKELARKKAQESNTPVQAKYWFSKIFMFIIEPNSKRRPVKTQKETIAMISKKAKQKPVYGGDYYSEKTPKKIITAKSKFKPRNISQYKYPSIFSVDAEIINGDTYCSRTRAKNLYKLGVSRGDVPRLKSAKETMEYQKRKGRGVYSINNLPKETKVGEAYIKTSNPDGHNFAIVKLKNKEGKEEWFGLDPYYVYESNRKNRNAPIPLSEIQAKRKILMVVPYDIA